MNFRDDHRPPLHTERMDIYYGTNLSDHERLLEDLEDRPSRSLLRAAGLQASLDGGSAPDRTVGASHGTPAANSPCQEAAGSNLKETT